MRWLDKFADYFCWGLGTFAAWWLISWLFGARLHLAVAIFVDGRPAWGF